MNRYLDIAPEVKEALDAGKPVVALESTIISHGMPYPQNVETALKVESIIRECGAVPATIAIIGGRLKAGLSKEEIDYLGRTGAAEVVDLFLGKTGLEAATDDGDGRGDRAAFADDALDLEGGLHVLGIGHTVGDDGGLQRDDGLAGVQRFLYFGGNVKITVHSE